MNQFTGNDPSNQQITSLSKNCIFDKFQESIGYQSSKVDRNRNLIMQIVGHKLAEQELREKKAIKSK